MSYRFRYALCNEVYQGWDFKDTCRSMRSIGYEGIEIAPFTLADDPPAIPVARRRELREIIEGEGLEFVGLHWLLVAPKGLHVTTPDADLRRKSWRHVEGLIDLCANLAGDRRHNGVLVFGSPYQRSTTGGLDRANATRHFIEGLAGIAPYAEDRRVTVLIEALPRNQCDVMLSLEEAVQAVREIASPGVQTMFDTHNAVDEAEPHPALVSEYFDWIRHVHVNETDGRHPGSGDYDFPALFGVLAERRYDGWISVEVFDFSAGAERIASDSLRYLQTVAGR